jgi:hypothetical protein
MDDQPPFHIEEHHLEHKRSEQIAAQRIEKRTMLQGLLAGVVTAAAFGLGGYFLLLDNSGAMGGVLFLLLPVASGFVTAMIAKRRSLVIASLLIALILCFVVLLLTGKEGVVCVLMAAPILAFGLALGAVAGALFRKYVLDRSRRPGIISLLVFLVTPFFLIGANSAEEHSRRIPRTETVVSTLIVDGPPDKVWRVIRSIDSLSSKKSFLMKIGLPVPVSCAMEGEGVGARRICYFNSGYIEERITQWDPPNSMGMQITASTLPGRPWLGFKDASYEIRRENGHTILTRSSTIISRLSPAWYWSRLERIGVETEHAYLFEEFKKRIDGGK